MLSRYLREFLFLRFILMQFWPLFKIQLLLSSTAVKQVFILSIYEINDRFSAFRKLKKVFSYEKSGFILSSNYLFAQTQLPQQICTKMYFVLQQYGASQTKVP